MTASARPLQAAPGARADEAPGMFAYMLAFYLAITVARLHEVVPFLSRLYIGKLSALLLIGAAFTQLRGVDFSAALKTTAAKCIGVITVLALLSVPGSAWPRQSAAFFIDWWPLVVLMFVCVIAAFGNHRVAYLCIVAVTLTAGLAAFEMLVLGRVDGGGRAFIGSDESRTYDANETAALFVMVLPYAFMLASRPGKLRWVGVAMIPMFIAGVLSTASRGGVVALGVLAIAMLWFVNPKQRKAYIGGLALMILLLPVMPTAGLVDRWNDLNSEKGDYNVTSRDGRIQVWKRGVGFMFSHPVLGVGVRAYEIANGAAAKSWVNAHNAFIQIGAELGLAGLAAFVTMIWVSFRGLSRYRARLWPKSAGAGGLSQESDPSRALATAAVCSLIALCAAAMFLSMAYNPMTLFALAVPTGLVMGTSVAALNGRAGRPLPQQPYSGPGWRSARRARPMGVPAPAAVPSVAPPT